MPNPFHPLLYQINTRCLLRELGPKATLDAVPDALLDRIRDLGFDWIWFLGVWQTGEAGRRVSRSKQDWRREWTHVLPDLSEEDITGSPFAVTAYTVHRDFGGDAALARLRERLKKRDLHLLLDFVPNHVGLDHPWTQAHPSFFLHGTEADLAHEPRNYTRIGNGLILAHGRDPYFDGWPDTLQLNYRHTSLRAAMIQELLGISDRCDGVRCDMAMLILPDVFQRTWGDRSLPGDGAGPADDSFWKAAIGCVRGRRPEFMWMAEAYWDLEWTLQQQGFDYTYDKRLYDRLRAGQGAAVRGHLQADADHQRRSVRFLENHDEPRAAAVFAPGQHQAAAVITFLVPGLRFFHEGQLEGRRAHASMHLGRRPAEPADETLKAFYSRLLEVLKRPEVRSGAWQLCACRPAWDGNGTWENFLVFHWESAADHRLLVVVNFGPAPGQCYAAVPVPALAGQTVRLCDLMSDTQYERHDLPANGLYVDLPAWGFHVFDVTMV